MTPNLKFPLSFQVCILKDSFLRVLMEVEPYMELFLENNGQHTKHFVILVFVYLQVCAFRHFTKKIVSWRICLKGQSATLFCGNSPKHQFFVRENSFDLRGVAHVKVGFRK